MAVLRFRLAVVDGGRIAPLVANGLRSCRTFAATARRRFPRSRSSMRSCTSRFERFARCRGGTTSCGMTFPRVARRAPGVTVTTPASCGCRLRATIVCRAADAVSRKQHRVLAGIRPSPPWRALPGPDDLEDIVGTHQRAPRASRSFPPARRGQLCMPEHRAHRESDRTILPRPFTRPPAFVLPRPAGR